MNSRRTTRWVIVLLVLTVVSTQAYSECLEGPGVWVIHRPPDREVASRILRLFPAALSRVTSQLSLPAPEHVSIYLVRSREEMRQYLGGDGGGDFAGLATTESSTWEGLFGSVGHIALRGLIAIRLDGEPGASVDDLEPMLVHEIAHVVVGQINEQLPAWFAEGLAGYCANQVNEELPALREIYKHDCRIPTLPEVDAWMAMFSRDSVHMAYGVSGLAIECFVRDHSVEDLQRLLREVATRSDFDSAFEAVTGNRPKAFEKRAGEYTRTRLAADAEADDGQWTPSGGLVGGSVVLLGLTLLVVWRRRRR